MPFANFVPRRDELIPFTMRMPLRKSFSSAPWPEGYPSIWRYITQSSVSLSQLLSTTTVSDRVPISFSGLFNDLISARNAQQQIAKGDRGSVANLRLVLSTDHGANTDAPGLRVAVAFERDRVQTLLAAGPIQFRQLCVDCIQPSGLARHVPVVPLFDVAGVAGGEISIFCRCPALVALGSVQSEMFPGVTVGRVLQNAAVCTHCLQSGFETSAIVTKLVLVRLGGAPRPEPPPERKSTP